MEKVSPLDLLYNKINIYWNKYYCLNEDSILANTIKLDFISTNASRKSGANYIFKIFFLSLLIIFAYDKAYSQTEMSEEISFIYLMKSYSDRNIDLYQFTSDYLKRFDENYLNYKNNEIEFSKKRDEAMVIIKDLMNENPYDKIFIYNSGPDFGVYDFDKQSFFFKPLKKGMVFKYAQDYSYDEKNQGVNAYISNPDDFGGLPMTESAADIFLKNRTINSYGADKVNRKVYVRIYFSITKQIYNRSQQNYSPVRFDLKNNTVAFIHKIEIWDDKCKQNRLLDSQIATSMPPEYLKKANSDFINKKVEKATLEKNFTNISSSEFYLINSHFDNQIESSCNSISYYDILMSVNKTQSSYNIQFKIWTNGCISFSPGFFYSFIDLGGNEYPLMVNTVNFNLKSDLPYVIVSLNLTNETYFMLKSNGIKKLKVQIQGTSTDPGLNEYKSIKFPDCVSIGNNYYFTWTLTDEMAKSLSQFISHY